MTLAPDALGDRYHVSFYGDDIPALGRPRQWRAPGPNPENGVFGAAKDTNEKTKSDRPGLHRALVCRALHQCRLQRPDAEVWWEGKTPERPADTAGWIDQGGERDRRPQP